MMFHMAKRKVHDLLDVLLMVLVLDIHHSVHIEKLRRNYRMVKKRIMTFLMDSSCLIFRGKVQNFGINPLKCPP